MTLPRFRLVSLMAENAAFFYHALGGYLACRTGIPVEVEESVAWQERERMLDRGEVEMGIICSLPYVRKVGRPTSHLFGPSPIPPAVISTRVPVGTRRALQQALLEMHMDPVGEKILTDAMTARFVGVKDADYHAIRAMALEATLVRWTPLLCLSGRSG